MGKQNPKWMSDYEFELRDYLSGAHHLAASSGLRSNFGAQLERMRDGLGPTSGGGGPRDHLDRLSNPKAETRADRAGQALRRMTTETALTMRAMYGRGVCSEGLEPFGYVLPVVLSLKLASDQRRMCPDSKPQKGVHAPGGDTLCGVCEWRTDDALRRVVRVYRGEPAKRGGKTSQDGQKHARAMIERLTGAATRALDAAQEAYALARAGRLPEETEAFKAGLTG